MQKIHVRLNLTIETLIVESTRLLKLHLHNGMKKGVLMNFSFLFKTYNAQQKFSTDFIIASRFECI